MIKKILHLLGQALVLWLLTTPIAVYAQLTTVQGGTGTSSPSGILYGDGSLHLKTTSIGSGCTFVTGTLSCSGTGDTFAWPFTPTSYGVSTSTTIGFLNGFLSNASSTVNGTLFLSGLTNGLLGVDGNSKVFQVASSTFQSPLVGTIGQTVYFSGTNTPVATSSIFINTNGNVGVGTTSPFAQLSIHANNGSTNTTLFAIGSSTATGTTTLFAVTNTGLVQLLGNTASTCGFKTVGTTFQVRLADDSNACNFSAATITSGNIFDTAGAYRVSSGVNGVRYTFDATADGIGLLEKRTATDFIRLDFGGITSSFPALSINSASQAISVSLADGSLGGKFGVGTSTPFSKFAVHANNGETNTTLFAIASSTATATTTLFSVSNAGLVTTASGINSAGTISSGGNFDTGNFFIGHNNRNNLYLDDTFQGSGTVGVARFSNTGNNDFKMLQFGGNTSSFVGLGVTNTSKALYVGLADGTLGGSFGVGTTSPFAQLSIHANNGSTNTTLFAIGSSTATGTTTLFSIGNTGSTTAANGFNITAGCFAINGTCLSSGSTLTGTLGQIPWFSGTNTAIGTSSLTLGSTNGFFGIASTTPGSLLSVGFNSSLVIASSSTYRSNATYTVPAGTVKLVVEAWGAGGAGGTSVNSSFPGGGGGGAGAFVQSTIFSPLSSYSIVIGQGGQAGGFNTSGAGGTGFQSGGTSSASSNNSGGGGGGSTAFGSIIACGGGGGGGGATSGTGGAAGSTSGGAGGTSAALSEGGGGGGGCATVGSGNTATTGGAGGTGGSTPTGTSRGGGSGGSSENIGAGGGSSSGVAGNGNTGGNGSGATPGTGATGSGGASAGANGTADDSGGGGSAGQNAGGIPGAGGGGNAASDVAGGGGAGGQGQVTVYAYTYVGIAPFTIGSAGNVVLQEQTSGGLFIGTSTPLTSNVFHEIAVASGFVASVVQQIINSVQYLTDILDQNGHHMTGGPAPTCGTGCSAVQGDDNNFRVTTGSGVTAVTINFANTWKTVPTTTTAVSYNITPDCVSNEESGGTTVSDASSTPTTVTFNLSASLTAKLLSVQCQGSNNFTF